MWVEEVAVKLDKGWVLSSKDSSKYRIFKVSVPDFGRWLEEKDRRGLLEILEEAEKNSLENR